MSVHKVRNIFITGGNRGIGLGLVKSMLIEFEPDHLFATYRTARNSQELMDLAAKNNNLHLIEFDVVDHQRLPEIVKQVETVTNAGINLLINNSGILGREYQGIRDITREDMLKHLETNTIAPVLITQAFLPLLEKAARSSKAVDGIQKAALVNVSTELGSIGENTSGGVFSYRMTKAALNMASKNISIDLKDNDITTIILHPGWVKTDLGSQRAPLTVDESVNQIMNTLKNANAETNGKFIRYDGTELPW